MEFTSEILQALSKRAWKLAWIFILNAVVSISAIITIFFYKKLYILNNISNLEDIYIDILKFLIQSFLSSILLFCILFILKGDSDNSIKKAREYLYKKIYERVSLVFTYRYNFPEEKYDKQIKELTQYKKIYTKENILHEIQISNLNCYIVDGIDSLYLTYQIKENEKILFSIWHSGKFIAIAIAIEKNLLSYTKDQIKEKFENTLNLADSNNAEKDRLSERDCYWWFDIKYDVSEDFLFNNIEKEQISRKVAHIVTVGLRLSMELLNWKEKQ